MAQLDIAEWGERILAVPAKPVTFPLSEQQRTTYADMLDTMNACDGVGIAATQVYSGDRAFIIASKPNPRYPHAPSMEPILMINPRIEQASRECIKDWEGCLSIPGIRARINRYQRIDVCYENIEGESQSQTLEGFIARIFQHELDHLNGMSLFDRARSVDIVTNKTFGLR